MNGYVVSAHKTPNGWRVFYPGIPVRPTGPVPANQVESVAKQLLAEHLGVDPETTKIFLRLSGLSDNGEGFVEYEAKCENGCGYLLAQENLFSVELFAMEHARRRDHSCHVIRTEVTPVMSVVPLHGEYRSSSELPT